MCLHTASLVSRLAGGPVLPWASTVCHPGDRMRREARNGGDTGAGKEEWLIVSYLLASGTTARSFVRLHGASAVRRATTGRRGPGEQPGVRATFASPRGSRLPLVMPPSSRGRSPPVPASRFLQGFACFCFVGQFYDSPPRVSMKCILFQNPTEALPLQSPSPRASSSAPHLFPPGLSPHPALQPAYSSF